MTSETARSIDDPAEIEIAIREATERTEKALRDCAVPIATEPLTVFRP